MSEIETAGNPPTPSLEILFGRGLIHKFLVENLEILLTSSVMNYSDENSDAHHCPFCRPQWFPGWKPALLLFLISIFHDDENERAAFSTESRFQIRCWHFSIPSFMSNTIINFYQSVPETINHHSIHLYMVPRFLSHLYSHTANQTCAPRENNSQNFFISLIMTNFRASKI